METIFKHSEITFQLIVESAPNAMILVNKEGKIAFVNKETERLFGYSRTELVGQGVEVIIPERFRTRHPHFRDAFFLSPQTRSMGAGRDLYARRKDGTEFPVEIGLNPLVTEEGTLVLAAVIDLTERKRAEERLRQVVESAPNAMVLVNGEGKITLVNSQTEKLFGFPREELMGQNVELLIPTRFRSAHPSYRGSFFSTPHARAMGAGRDLFARRKDGTEFPVEIGLNPLETAEGTMVLAAIIDITERKTQEANKLKSDFLARMSHELRTPMNAILGFSELLIDERVGELNGRQKDYLKDIHASAEHLLQLINDILDISKIESGKTELKIETFDVVDVIEEVMKVLAPLAAKKQITVQMQLSPDVTTVSLDKSKFRQILYNLLSNAIKYNKQNGEASISTYPDGQDRFRMEIMDTGVGIAKENMHKLFIPFVQLDATAAARNEGTGLGLALTKNIIELHGGKISVDSTLGEGTTFSVVMPKLIVQKQEEA